MTHYCYILKNNSINHKNITYNGYTNNPIKRLRQHNKEISGGAKYTTSKDSQWEIYVLLSGFTDKQNALSCEWKIKHPDNKKIRKAKYRGINGRVIGLNEILKLEYWTGQSKINNKTQNLTLYICKDVAHLLTDILPNIKIIIVDKIILNDICIDQTCPPTVQ